MPGEPIPLIIDCDTGIDDAMALVYALLHERARLVAIGSVHGNVRAPLGAENSLRVLEMLGRGDIPVAVGAERPLAQDLETAEWVHGDDGLGNTWLPKPKGRPTEEHAADQIVRLARERPGELTLVAVGPMTNVALALMKEPRLPALVRQVVVMGGAALAPGNSTATAEANIWHDPEAADLVFTAGWPLAMVGLDVTMKVRLGPPHRARLRAMAGERPIAGFLDSILEFYTKVYERTFHEPACAMHDPLAVGIALDPAFATYANWVVRVEKCGEFTRGMTVADRRDRDPEAAGDMPMPDDGAPRTRVAIDVEADRFMDDFFRVLENAPARTPGGAGV